MRHFRMPDVFSSDKSAYDSRLLSCRDKDRTFLVAQIVTILISVHSHVRLAAAILITFETAALTAVFLVVVSF